MDAGSIDAQYVRSTARLEPEGRVVLVTQRRQSRAFQAVAGERRSPEAPQAPDLPAPTQ
jgi:hypothetical protein